jgi:exonuclease III
MPALRSPLDPATAITWSLATCNVLNLALAGQVTYPNQDPFSPEEAGRKTQWLGRMFARLAADVVGVQEVWHRDALVDAVAASGLRYPHVIAPGAEQGASGTPRVALVSRRPLDDWSSIA